MKQSLNDLAVLLQQAYQRFYLIEKSLSTHNTEWIELSNIVTRIDTEAAEANIRFYVHDNINNQPFLTLTYLLIGPFKHAIELLEEIGENEIFSVSIQELDFRQRVITILAIKRSEIEEAIEKVYSEVITMLSFKDVMFNDKTTDEQKDFRMLQAEEWIVPDRLETFLEIEEELQIRGYINNNSYFWKDDRGRKMAVIDLLIILTENNFFNKRIRHQSKKFFHYKQFISIRYGFGKTGLSDMIKQYKPKVNTSLATFYWIKKYL